MRDVDTTRTAKQAEKGRARTPLDGLNYLRSVIPDFDERCKTYVEKLMYMGEQRRVVRAGYDKFQFYSETHGVFLPWDSPYTDADHVFHLINAVILFKDFFGEFIPWLYGFEPQWLDIVEEMVFHEVGEPEIGDWTDDGSRDTEEKNRLEQEVFDRFMSGFPKSAQKNHQRQFASVRDGTGIGKLFDKQGFLNGIAFAKMHWSGGDISSCNHLSKRDNSHREATKSNRCFDLVYADMLTKYRDHPFLPFFIGINEAIYAVVYTDNDPTVEGCVAGQVPPGVRKYYL